MRIGAKELLSCLKKTSSSLLFESAGQIYKVSGAFIVFEESLKAWLSLHSRNFSVNFENI
jgi:hypothetical protein